ncbi:hypothetical protein [Novosphingobium jiangmenense]|uniref:Uncharacterized protein n=1 Tax=Novosphingobium jiangmenense TaxID=2791981 RepID=A0ABS0HHS0_9SPHN|nr:hypothetical protein [Novosphingobium jiangmenense]MBF9151708.1 hypothetical protein [Novosphingobium jiangmenense]
MLEALTPDTLRTRLRLSSDPDGSPAVGSVAEVARTCVRAWRSPARARVTAYLHRQFLAAGFAEDLVRGRVSDVVDALIDVGDITPVRLGGKASLVLSRQRWIAIAPDDFAFLGNVDAERPAAGVLDGYVRRSASLPEHASAEDFALFMGAPGYRRHLARRTAGSGDGAIQEFWATLTSALRHDGQPLDPSQMRAVIDPPGSHNGYFGQHNQPTVSGRWKLSAPEGVWCGARPGRSANEWHPILIGVSGSEVVSLDLFDWDEWAWALLARGYAVGAPERSEWKSDTLSFQHPVPAHYLRAMRLLARPGEKRWTWIISAGAHAAFSGWLETAL